MQDSSRLTLVLEETENWLYEEGEDQPKEIYLDKLTELKVDILTAYAFYNRFNHCNEAVLFCI